MSDLARYHRQMLLAGIGETGQKRLRSSHALIVGCGALGTIIADSLARAGVGTLTIVDRDVVELTNLQRQVLFDERDVAERMPKAEAARAKLARVNSEIEVRAQVEDFNARNAERFIAGVDVILDGLDNFQTRYLLNDLAVARGIPYCYGGAVGTTGMSMPILPHTRERSSSIRWSDEQSTPCLRCLFPEAPPPGTTPTCDTAGVLSAAVAIIAAHQVAQAIKLLTGNFAVLDRSLLSIDLWANTWHRFEVATARESSDCPCCVHGRFDYLKGEAASASTSLCGRNAVQITPPAGDTNRSTRLDLAQLAARLAPHGQFSHNRFLLQGALTSAAAANGEHIELIVFPDGRAIIKGVTQPEAARTIYDRYIGG